MPPLSFSLCFHFFSPILLPHISSFPLSLSKKAKNISSLSDKHTQHTQSKIMAVEARRLNLFPSQILSNTRGMAPMNGNIEGVYGAPMMGYGGVVAPPLSGTTTATEMLAPMYDSEAFPAKISAIKSDSGLSYAVPVSRKRPRDASTNQMLQNVVVSNNFDINSNNNRCGSITFLGEDFSFQFQQQQLEIDRFIAQHTEKVRLEVEERRKRYSRRIAAAVEENVMKRLRAKEEEIERMGKLNWALEERVRSLCVENQIWRDLAQTNEATANALRCNLEQVLAQAAQDDAAAAIADEDAESSSSCCGSNNSGDDVRVTTAMCRSCGKEESSVLLLPCRHLCLCTLCGSSLQTCPVCNSPQTASVHVNLSPT